MTRCGLSVIETGKGRHVTALDVDVVRTPADQPLAKRLLTISDTVEHWLDTHVPDVIAIERVFSQPERQHRHGHRAGRSPASSHLPPATTSTMHFHTPASQGPSPETAGPTNSGHHHGHQNPCCAADAG